MRTTAELKQLASNALSDYDRSLDKLSDLQSAYDRAALALHLGKEDHLAMWDVFNKAMREYFVHLDETQQHD